MASRLHESINSLGVLLALAVSFFGFYYEHIRTSEAVDVWLSTTSLIANDTSKKVDSMSVDLLFLNKGDSSIPVSELWCELDDGTPPFRVRLQVQPLINDEVSRLWEFCSAREKFEAHVLVRELIRMYPKFSACERLDRAEMWHWAQARAAVSDSYRHFLDEVHLNQST